MPIFTEKQLAARGRNWRIRSLRGLFYHTQHLDVDLRQQMEDLIETQLARLGAESERMRRQTIADYWEKVALTNDPNVIDMGPPNFNKRRRRKQPAKVVQFPIKEV